MLDETWANVAHPLAKKSPTGTSTAGSAAESQVARSTSSRQCRRWVVSQTWVILPGPSISATTCVVPGATSTEGETFHPTPRSRAQAAPVPSVARAPPPRLPSGFSGLIERVWMPRRRASEEDVGIGSPGRGCAAARRWDASRKRSHTQGRRETLVGLRGPGADLRARHRFLDVSPLTWLRRHDPGLRALRRAARVAIVMPLLFAFGTQVLHDADVATFSAFGSFALLLLVEVNGSRAERVQGIAWLGVVGALLVCLATVVSRQPVLAAVTMAVVGFAVLFVGVVSSELAGASTALLLAFVLPVATPAPIEAIPARVAGWLLAAVVAAVAVAFWWPAPPRNPLRGPSAQTCRLFAERLLADHRVAVGDLSAEERDRVAGALTTAYTELRDAFYATPNRPTDLGTSSRILVRLVDELGWLLTIDGQSPPVAAGHQVDVRVLAVKTAAAHALQAAADALDAMSHGAVQADADAGEMRLRNATGDLRSAVEVLETGAERLPLGRPRGAAGAGGVELDAGMVDALEPTFRAQEVAFAVLEIATNVD